MTRIRKMDADTLFALAMKGAGPDLRAWLRKKKHQPRVWAVFKEAARALEKKRGSHGVKPTRQPSKVTMRMAMQFGGGDESFGLNGVGWLPWSGEAWEWPAEGVLYASDGHMLGAIPVAQAPERPVFWSWSNLTERAGKAGKAGKGSLKKQAIRALGSLTPEAFLDKVKDWRPRNPDPAKIFGVVPLVDPTRLDTGALYRLLKQYKWRSLLGTKRPGVELSWGPGEAVTVSFYQAIRRKDKAQVNGPVRDIWGTGKHKKTAFNPRYLRQVCKHFPGSRTQIRTASHLGPFMIARPDYFAIIMPMRADEGFPRKRTVEVPAKITWGKTQTIKATEKQAVRKGLKTVELKGKAVQGVVDRIGGRVTIWRVPSRMSGWAWAPVPLREIEPAQFLDPKTAASGNKKLTKTEAKRQAEVFEGTAEDSVDDVTQRLLDQAKNTRAKPGGPVERTVVAAAQSTGKVSKKSGEVVRKALRYPLFVGGWSNALVYATPRHLRSRVGRAFNAHVMRALVRMLQQGEARFRTIPTDVALRRFSPRASAVAGGPTQYVLELTDR